MAKKPKTSSGKKRRTKTDAPGAVPAGNGDNSKNGELTPNEVQQLFLQHRTSWNQWKAKRAVVDELERDVKVALKGDGYTVKQMEIADQLATVKGEVKVTDEVRDRLKVARWIGHPMGAQLDLFETPRGSRRPHTENAYDAGKLASMQNQPRKPPHDPSTVAYGEWMAGYEAHQASLREGFKAPPPPAGVKLDGDGVDAVPPEDTAEEVTSGERVSRSDFRKRLGDLAKL